MNSASDQWVTVSNCVAQTVSAIVIIVIGLLLTLVSLYIGDGSTETTAAFLLGLLLLVAGLGTLLLGGKQRVTVDPNAQRIIFEHKNRFGKSSKHINFNEITDIYVDEVGDNEGGCISYQLVVRLTSGKEIPLFAGFFDGRYDQSVMNAHCQRLLSYVYANN